MSADHPLPAGSGRFTVAEPSRLVPSGELAVARAEIAAFAGADALARAAQAQILAFLDEHPDALHRSCAPGHLTGSALVLDAASGRFLLLLHAKLGKWLQPGGHTDGEANLALTARREAEEETGVEGLAVVTPAVDLDVHVVRPPGEAAHLHLDVRHLVLAPPGARAQGNHESLELRWVDLGEAEALGADPSTLRLARAALAAAAELRGP
ncbi:MAG: NUDIX hydrolase [Acidimicrobiales bacterium]